MRRAVVAALIAGLCSAGMTACSDDPSPDPPATASSTTSTTTPTTPTTTSPTEPVAPQLPALAREQSRAGAKAFVRYYIELLNYSILAESGTLLTAISTTSCGPCRSVAELADSLRRNGGSQEGGLWKPRNLYFIPLQPDSRPIVDASIQVSPGRFKLTAESAVRQIPREVIHNEFRLKASPAGWLMNNMESS